MASKPYLPRLARKLAHMGETKAKARVRSKQLRRGMYIRENTEDPRKQAIVIPHFWATYIHDGRGCVTPQNSPILIWFRDRKKDPRLFNGNTPESLSQTRTMTRAQFKYWTGINRGIIRAYKGRTGKKVLTQAELESLKLPMIVATKSPRSGSFVPGQFFFANEPGGGMHGFKDEADAEVDRTIGVHVRATLKQAGIFGVKIPITVRL